MSKFCKDGIIVNAQEYKKYRNVWRGVGRSVSERLFGDYKALMDQLRTADDDLRQTALGRSGKIDIGIKEAIQRANTALKENRLIDSLYYVGLIDVITREVIAKALPTVSVLKAELYKQYSESNEGDALKSLDEQYKNAQETLNIIAKYSVEINKNAQFLQNIYRGLMGGDPMQRAWQQEVRKFRMPVEKAVNSGYRFVDRLIVIFDKLGIARSSGKIGDWVSGINEIIKIQPALNKEVLSAYQKIQPIIEAARQDQNIAAEQSKEAKPEGLNAVMQDVTSNVIEKIEPKEPVNIPDLEIPSTEVVNNEPEASQVVPEVVSPVVEQTPEEVTKPAVEPEVVPVVEPVVEPLNNDSVEKAVEKVKKQKQIKTPKVNKDISNEVIEPEIIDAPEVVEPVVPVESIKPPVVDEPIKEPVEELTEQESAEKYKEVLDAVDNLDEQSTNNLYGVLNSVIDGAENNEIVYRDDDDGVKSDIGKIDEEGNVEISGTDLEFPKEMAEKILLYVDKAGLAPVEEIKTIIEPEVVTESEGLFDKVEPDENLGQSKLETIDDELDEEEEEEEQFGRLKGLKNEEQLTSGNPIGNYKGTQAIVNTSNLKKFLDSNNDTIKSIGQPDLLFGDDTEALIVLYKGKATYPMLASSANALQNYLGKYVEVTADRGTANKIYDQFELEGMKISIISMDEDQLKEIVSFSEGGVEEGTTSTKENTTSTKENTKDIVSKEPSSTLIEEESAEKYKQVLDSIDKLDESEIEDLYAVATEAAKGIGNNEIIYRNDNDVNYDVGRVDNNGDVEVIGVDLEFPKEMAEKILYYLVESKLVIPREIITSSKPDAKKIEVKPEEVKPKKTRKPMAKKEQVATASIDHTRFFNKIKKVAKLNDPYLMAHMMLTYSEAMEGKDTEISIRLLEKAKEILDA